MFSHSIPASLHVWAATKYNQFNVTSAHLFSSCSDYKHFIICSITCASCIYFSQYRYFVLYFVIYILSIFFVLLGVNKGILILVVTFQISLKRHFPTERVSWFHWNYFLLVQKGKIIQYFIKMSEVISYFSDEDFSYLSCLAAEICFFLFSTFTTWS